MARICCYIASKRVHHQNSSSPCLAATMESPNTESDIKSPLSTSQELRGTAVGHTSSCGQARSSMVPQASDNATKPAGPKPSHCERNHCSLLIAVQHCKGLSEEADIRYKHPSSSGRSMWLAIARCDVAENVHQRPNCMWRSSVSLI